MSTGIVFRATYENTTINVNTFYTSNLREYFREGNLPFNFRTYHIDIWTKVLEQKIVYINDFYKNKSGFSFDEMINEAIQINHTISELHGLKWIVFHELDKVLSPMNYDHDSIKLQWEYI